MIGSLSLKPLENIKVLPHSSAARDTIFFAWGTHQRNIKLSSPRCLRRSYILNFKIQEGYANIVGVQQVIRVEVS